MSGSGAKVFVGVYIGFGVWVWGLGFRVWGLGCTDSPGPKP